MILKMLLLLSLLGSLNADNSLGLLYRLPPDAKELDTAAPALLYNSSDEDQELETEKKAPSTGELAKVQRLIDSADRDGDGKLSEPELVDLYARVQEHEEHLQVYKDSFDAFDTNKDGKISHEELAPIPDEELFALADLNHNGYLDMLVQQDGYLDLSEFKIWFHGGTDHPGYTDHRANALATFYAEMPFVDTSEDGMVDVNELHAHGAESLKDTLMGHYERKAKQEL